MENIHTFLSDLLTTLGCSNSNAWRIWIWHLQLNTNNMGYQGNMKERWKKIKCMKTRLRCKAFCPQKGWAMMGNQLIIYLAIGVLVTQHVWMKANYPTRTCIHEGVQIYVELIPNNEVEQLFCSKLMKMCTTFCIEVLRL